MNDVRRLPIPNVSSPHQHDVSKRVDHIVSAKQRDAEADTTALEREIDRLVYDLYGLTPAEIKLVEESSAQ